MADLEILLAGNLCAVNMLLCIKYKTEASQVDVWII